MGREPNTHNPGKAGKKLKQSTIKTSKYKKICVALCYLYNHFKCKMLIIHWVVSNRVLKVRKDVKRLLKVFN